MDPRLASSHLHADSARLAAQVALSWPREWLALQRLGLRDGMTILEVGCGPGFVTQRLLEALPHSLVLAIEPDQQMANAARERLDRAFGSRLQILESSIGMTPFPDDAFDFVFARFVFQHIPAPDLACSEIFRLLKPGGRVVIVDIDDDLGGLLMPSLPAMQHAFRTMHALQFKRGGDRRIGRKLWRLLGAAGFGELDLAAVVVHSDDVGLDAFRLQYAPERLRQWMGPGGLTEDDWLRYSREFEIFMRRPDALILQLFLLASGQKPTT